MAKKISQLTQATEVKSDDVTVIVQDGETKKLPLNMMVTKQDIENKKVAGLAKLDEIETTYENDTYTPTITVKNKSSVKTGEGDEVDYSANVMDGHAKSAILKGKTLVNLWGQAQEDFFLEVKGSFDNGVVTANGWCCSKRLELFKPNTEYTLITNIISISDTNTYFKANNVSSNGIFKTETNKLNKVGIYVEKVVSYDDFTGREFSARSDVRGGGTVKYSMIILEGDHTQSPPVDYFEGMQSVKVPVLKTTGKNLFDKDAITLNKCLIWLTGAEGTENNSFISDYIKVENGIHYSISGASLLASRLQVFGYDKDKKPICSFNESGGEVGLGYSSGVTNNSIIIKNSYYIRVAFRNLDGVMQDINNIQLEESPTPTPYEPYKSNILSTPSDLELRGIGNVQDTLDLLTGEVTERIGEIVLDGSEDWALSDATRPNHLRLYCHQPRFKQYQNVINDRFADNGNIQGRDIEGIYMTNTIDIQVEHSRLSDVSVNAFKIWLSENPITIQARLSEKSIKTVDLMPSGTHPSTTPYCWKNGHIQLSSSGLLPNLEYSVVTSRAGQINQNATMIVKNDKRIFDLEILLAGGLVNTTYQALTLQNQVETGLSKVSLNSETEPDYLLYHMIMKLIEEKAYKLDDLTEKVSVFYLYEKLSDEQFETIYSALYPFVEDEIVEEPVVEELPEVVEDEVIM